MDGVSFVDVFPAAQRRAAHATALEDMRKAAFDDLTAFAYVLLTDARSQPIAVSVDRRASLVVAMPAQIAFAQPRLGNARRPWAVVEFFQKSRE